VDAQNDCPMILLSSGQTLKLRKILLYEEPRVNEVALLRAQAVKGMAGVSTGIGFWGSPLWALGGAAALGLVEGALSSSARKQALQYLGIAAERTKGLIETRAGRPAHRAAVRGRCVVINGQIQIGTRYVHDGDDFVHVETDVGKMSIRWQEVVAYSLAGELTFESAPTPIAPR
jgi:hypothetical protein